jgi:hypothetical protein
VLAASESGGEKAPIPYTGTSYGAIPVGNVATNALALLYPNLSTEAPNDKLTAALSYEFWYY